MDENSSEKISQKQQSNLIFVSNVCKFKVNRKSMVKFTYIKATLGTLYTFLTSSAGIFPSISYCRYSVAKAQSSVKCQNSIFHHSFE